MAYTVNDFVSSDNKRSLFPLKSTEKYIKLGGDKLKELIYGSIFDDKNKAISFVTCPIAYALKDKMHLRRLLLLDPVSTYYIYDYTINNRKLFEKQEQSNREYYGYSFEAGKPTEPVKQYHDFRRRKYLLKQKYAYFAKIDIANCFNSFYHHELVSYLRTNLADIEGRQFGQFLREINSGTSINCFPQGIYPAKTIGNRYLSFSESSMELQSSAIIRFLDDFFLFADDLKVIEKDIIIIQQLLGGQGLFLNERKTQFGSKKSDFEERKLDSIKKSLLQKREDAREYDSDEDDDEEKDDESKLLDDDEVEYLTSIIKSKDVAEEDVELALSLLKQEKEAASLLISLVFDKFPHLIKDLYRHLSDIDDDGELWAAISKQAASPFLTEFELFWLVRIILDIYDFDNQSAEILLKLFKHPCASPIVKAAILECEHNNYGFAELKLAQLRSGAEGIIATSAVSGIHMLEKGKRNQVYKYLSKSSQYLYVMCDIMSNT